MTLSTVQSNYIAALPFLINQNEKWCSESNILTMGHDLLLKIPVQLLLTHRQMPLSI